MELRGFVCLPWVGLSMCTRASGAQCLNRVWLPAANCQCTDDARIDA